jgi:hypothetical protein
MDSKSTSDAKCDPGKMNDGVGYALGLGVNRKQDKRAPDILGSTILTRAARHDNPGVIAA